MPERPDRTESINPSEKQLVLSELEPDQLAGVKANRYPRRKLSSGQVMVLWGLRIYVLLMVAVVIYQIWNGSK